MLHVSVSFMQTLLGLWSTKQKSGKMCSLMILRFCCDIRMLGLKFGAMPDPLLHFYFFIYFCTLFALYSLCLSVPLMCCTNPCYCVLCGNCNFLGYILFTRSFLTHYSQDKWNHISMALFRHKVICVRVLHRGADRGNLHKISKSWIKETSH